MSEHATETESILAVEAREATKRAGRGGRGRAKPEPQSHLSAEELEIAENARLAAGDDWSGAVAPGKASNFKASFGRLLGLLAPYKASIIFTTVLGAIGVLLTVAIPKILAEATNLLIEGITNLNLGNQGVPSGITKEQFVSALTSGQVPGMSAAQAADFAKQIQAMHHFAPGEGVDFVGMSRIIWLVIVLYVVSSLLLWIQGYVVNLMMMKAMYQLRDDVESKINRLPLRYFDRVQRGDLISRVTNNIDNITQTMQQALGQVITNVLTVVGVLIMMLTVSWQLTLVVLVAFPLMAVIFGTIGPKSQKAFQSQWVKVGKLNARVEESFSGHTLVKVFGHEQSTLRDFAEENEELYQASFKAQFLSNLMMPLIQFVGNFQYVGVAVFGSLMVASGSLRLGDVQAFIQYSQQFNQPLGQLGQMATMIQSGTASAERVFELLDEDEQEPDAADAPAPAEGDGTIEFQNVAFSYTPERPLIKDLSFTVKPGQTVAIVGPTGAGKTTLVNLVMRFYELNSGRILLNGQNIADLSRHDIRAKTGMVLQDPWLFNGTIRENIRYGRADATDAEIEAAARATYVDRFVHSLPDGYETVLDEDASNVSAGERQLITIARAFVAQPAVLILDEATSSVDTRTELLLQHAMAALRHGRTSFVIAHRLSTIRDADLILVMEHGDIVEQGNHADLIGREGAYWRLYQSQFEQAASDLDYTTDAQRHEVERAEAGTPAVAAMGGTGVGAHAE